MVLIPNSEKHVMQSALNVFHDVCNREDDFSSEDDYNFSEDEFDEEDTEVMLMEINENNIAPHFKDMALAIKNRDVNGLQIAIDNLTGNIDENSIDGETALHYACLCCSRKSFEPMHKAASENINIVKLLLDIVIEIDNSAGRSKMIQAVDIYGQTPLHEAALYDKFKIVILLLEFGASTQARTNEGMVSF
ncbi:uncharacterized protein LOC124939136 [Impatiens glandulifera]|uniref:uncharacterized protein LOC124939136 n=1 Tax=Impatiens glandulifera TaxID=253017 RepID=UPI001FB119FF|nr:uncharacterized protein LOC124939136 [Impatiens glandulifera]